MNIRYVFQIIFFGQILLTACSNLHELKVYIDMEKLQDIQEDCFREKVQDGIYKIKHATINKYGDLKPNNESLDEYMALKGVFSTYTELNMLFDKILIVERDDDRLIIDVTVDHDEWSRVTELISASLDELEIKHQLVFGQHPIDILILKMEWRQMISEHFLSRATVLLDELTGPRIAYFKNGTMNLKQVVYPYKTILVNGQEVSLDAKGEFWWLENSRIEIELPELKNMGSVGFKAINKQVLTY